MKSTAEQLRSRGFAGEGEESAYEGLSDDDLAEFLSSADAWKRTIGVRVLAKRKGEAAIPVLCNMLKNEKKLYTKITLCDCLSGFGAASVPHLIPLLGTIGGNQHREIRAVDLGKKCYPLPRDIAARTLMRIGPGAFPGLREVLRKNINRDQVTEALDVIGYITWNSNDFSMEDTLLDFYKKNKNDDFLTWKVIRVFQSFRSEEIIRILEYTQKNHPQGEIVKEARRSLERISLRKSRKE